MGVRDVGIQRGEKALEAQPPREPWQAMHRDAGREDFLNPGARIDGDVNLVTHLALESRQIGGISFRAEQRAGEDAVQDAHGVPSSRLRPGGKAPSQLRRNRRRG